MLSPGVLGLGRVREVTSGIIDFDAGSEIIHPPWISLYFDFGYVAQPQKQGQPRRIEQIGGFRLALPPLENHFQRNSKTSSHPSSQAHPGRHAFRAQGASERGPFSPQVRVPGKRSKGASRSRIKSHQSHASGNTKPEVRNYVRLGPEPSTRVLRLWLRSCDALQDRIGIGPYRTKRWPNECPSHITQQKEAKLNMAANT